MTRVGSLTQRCPRAMVQPKRKKKKKFKKKGVPTVAQQVKNPTSMHEDMGSIPGFPQRVKDLALPQAAV